MKLASLEAIFHALNEGGVRYPTMGEDNHDIDWTSTTWEGSRRAQLRRALTLTIRERLEAMEGLADVARRFGEIRASGGFRSDSPDAQAAPKPMSASDPPRRDGGK